VADAARLEFIQRTRVEQAVDRERFGQFSKEILRAETPAGRSLAIVRKLRDDIERRGAVLLVHGFAQNRYSWHLSTRSFVNYLADLGLDVYNLELTGHGRSRDYGTASARSFSDYVDDGASVIRAVAQWSGLGRTFVAGHSLGGAVCYAAAPRVREQVAGIVGIAGLFRFGANPVTRGIAEFLEQLGRIEPIVRTLGAGVRTRLLGRVIAQFWEHADDLFWSFPMAGWVPGSTEPHVVQERLIRGFDWTGLNILLTMMRWAADGSFTGERGENYEEAFAALDVPLLVVAGDRDRLLPPEDARPAYDISRSHDKTYKLFSPAREEVHWGHLDIVLGRLAPTYVWPYVGNWILERCPSISPSATRIPSTAAETMPPA
jgi:alpha-beta hydrolase superfamily lysophospholipase